MGIIVVVVYNLMVGCKGKMFVYDDIFLFMKEELVDIKEGYDEVF